MKIARVFPRKTKASPDDELAFFDAPGLFPPEVDEVHVSVAFTYDLPKAEYLAKQWERVAPVKIGGPALGKPSGNFTPGMYLKKGYVITSRGCPNRCWFCSVPKRENGLHELPITDGWNLLDDNLLACSDGHIRSVFAMLQRQPVRPIFTGGLEARLLRAWHVELLREAKAQRMYFAYDTPDDYEPLVQAGKYLSEAGFPKDNHIARCYVLIGYKNDSFEKAENRLRQAWDAGFFPFAMLYHDKHGKCDLAWKQFQREWARPKIVATKLKNEIMSCMSYYGLCE